MMPLSQAFLLGSTLGIKRRRCTIAGCALTMCAAAIGKGEGTINDIMRLHEAYPWLGEYDFGELLCGCDILMLNNAARVAHYWDFHVMTGEWTDEKLYQVIQEMEPRNADEETAGQDPRTDITEATLLRL